MGRMATSAIMTRIYINDGPGEPGVLIVEQHVETLWSNLPRPNPSWKYTDREGHGHTYAEDDEQFATPTLDVEYEHVPCDGACGDGGCEGYDESHYYCRICREEIAPGLLYGPHRINVPGLRSWTVRVESRAGAVGDEVAIRAERGTERFLGRAQVVKVEAQRGPDYEQVSTELVGVSELSGRSQS